MALQGNQPYNIVRRVGNQGTRAPVSNQAGNDKLATWKHFDLRSTVRFGNLNFRKLKVLGKLTNICIEMYKDKIDILGISETNWNNSGSFRSTEGNKTVLFSGQGEREYCPGVGVILSKAASNVLLGYFLISDRVIKLRIQCKQDNLSIYTMLYTYFCGC